MQIELSLKETLFFSRCLTCLARVGKELFLRITKNSFQISTVDEAESSYLILCFGSIPLYLFLRSFRSLRNLRLERTVFMQHSDSPEHIHVRFEGEHQVIRTHSFTLHNSQCPTPSSLSWRNRNFFIVSPSKLIAVLQQFNATHSNAIVPDSVSGKPQCIVEDVSFFYDSVTQGLCVETFEPQMMQQVYSHAEFTSGHDSEETKHSSDKSLRAGCGTHLSDKRQNNMPSTTNMFTKTSLPPQFFDKFYLDPKLRTSTPFSVGLGPLNAVSALCEDSSTKLCVTWRSPGKPLFVTFGDYAAIGHRDILLSQRENPKNIYTPQQGIEEIEKQKNSGGSLWTGLLWLSTTGSGDADFEDSLDTIDESHGLLESPYSHHSFETVPNHSHMKNSYEHCVSSSHGSMVHPEVLRTPVPVYRKDIISPTLRHHNTDFQASARDRIEQNKTQSSNVSQIVQRDRHHCATNHSRWDALKDTIHLHTHMEDIIDDCINTEEQELSQKMTPYTVSINKSKLCSEITPLLKDTLHSVSNDPIDIKINDFLNPATSSPLLPKTPTCETIQEEENPFEDLMEECNRLGEISDTLKINPHDHMIVNNNENKQDPYQWNHCSYDEFGDSGSFLSTTPQSSCISPSIQTNGWKSRNYGDVKQHHLSQIMTTYHDRGTTSQNTIYHHDESEIRSSSPFRVDQNHSTNWFDDMGLW